MPSLTATAIIAGTTAAAGLGSALIGSSAAKNAATVQADAANRSADIQQGMFNTIRGDLAPYRTAGAAALPSYLKLLGIGDMTGGGGAGGPDWSAYLQQNPDVATDYTTHNLQAQGFATPEDYAQYHYHTYGQAEGRALPTIAANPATSGSADIQTALENLPGYQFTRDQGIKSLTNQLSASGMGGTSGAYAKGIARYVTGLADTTYGEQLDRIRAAVGGGQGAANQTGAFGTTTAANVGNTLQQGAQATASGIVGSANAISGGLSTVPSSLLTSRILGMYAPTSPPPSGGYSPGSYDMAGVG